jgi:hypothetical protein
MPTYQHEVPLQMIRQRPDLAVEILRDAVGVDVPPYDRVIQASENLSVLHPAEQNCDGAVLATRDDKPVYGIVVESQLRKDEEKQFDWPAYLSTFRHQHACDADLLVLCPNETTAHTLATPIQLGLSGSVVYPVAVSPKDLSPVTDLDEARRCPELAVYTAPAHVDGPQGPAVIHAFAEALEVINRADGKLYHDYARSLFSDAAKKLLGEFMKVHEHEYQWQSDFAIEHIAEGEVEEASKAVLIILRARKICVSDQARQRINDCGDLDQLERWLERAATVNTVEELFE